MWIKTVALLAAIALLGGVAWVAIDWLTAAAPDVCRWTHFYDGGDCPPAAN